MSKSKVGGLFVALVCPFAAADAPPSAVVSYSIDGAPATTIPILGSFAQNGNASFASTFAPAGVGWKLDVNLSSDFTADPNGNLVGIITFTNQSDATREVLVTVTMPICPMLKGGSLVGGTTTLSLHSSEDGGTLSCAGSPAVITFLANDDPIGALFHCPLNLSSGGAGTMTSTGTFGMPGPSDPGPMVLETIGMRQHLKITGQDKAQVQFNYLLLDPPGVHPCEADINGDGRVGAADLTFLFAQWGGSGAGTCLQPHSADLDRNGVVNGADLAYVLAAWGDPCQP